MPISLETIENKLLNGDFANLSELESYVKRLVQNAKDYYPRNSQIFEDAERVRKATSNYMVKTNPAYKLVPQYSAIPTPIPDDLEGDFEPSPNAGVDAEADGEPDAEGEVDADGEAEVEEDEEESASLQEEEQEEAAGDEDAEAGEEESEEEEDVDADSDDGQAPVVIRRRGPGRPPKNPELHAQKASAGRLSSAGAKLDHEYEKTPYKGLTFQQAQEKVVEELIRKPDEE